MNSDVYLYTHIQRYKNESLLSLLSHQRHETTLTLNKSKCLCSLSNNVLPIIRVTLQSGDNCVVAV